jgi:hypothetical protein
MLDALFCCYIIAANVKQAGYFARATGIVSRAAARCRALRAEVMLRCNPKQRSASSRATALDCGFQDDWVKRLTRLENYVTAMA